MIRLAIRGFVNATRLFEDRIEIEESELESMLPQLAERHATAMAQHELTMIEIEFLDEPDPNERFFRIGTDPSGMVLPLQINLAGEVPNDDN